MDMYSDNRFDNDLSEEDVSRATEVIVPAPDATPVSDNQVSDNQEADNQGADNQMSGNQGADCQTLSNQATGNQPAPYVSQEEFPSAALMSDAGHRVSLGRAVGVSAAVGVAGVCTASVLSKEDASLSRAATPDEEKSADEIAANVGIGDDVERVEVPAEPHVTVTYEDMTGDSGMGICSAGHFADVGADHANVVEASASIFDEGVDSLCADI